jgi:branched-chain amino acid transport system substrate-binding protein
VAPAPVAAKTLTIGNINSLTGMFSDFEQWDPQGAQLAADLINNRGGITINGQKYLIDLYVLDGKATTDGCSAAATAMVYDKNIKFICGEAVTPLALAVDTVTEPGGAIFSARFNNASPNEMGPKFPLKFVGGNCYLSGIKASLDYLKQTQPNVKTFAFTAIDDGTLKTLTPVLEGMASADGLTMVGGGVIGFTFDLTDMTPICQKLVALNPDAVMQGAMTITSEGMVTKGCRALGYTGSMFGCIPGAADQELAVIGAQNMEGYFLPGFPGDPTLTSLPQNAVDLIKLGIAKYGKFNMTHFQGANGLYSMVMAIQAAQSLDPKVVAAKWETMTSIDTPYGPGTMGGLQTYGVNHNVYSATAIQGIHNGVISLVATIPLDQSAMP